MFLFEIQRNRLIANNMGAVITDAERLERA